MTGQEFFQDPDVGLKMRAGFVYILKTLEF